MRNLEVEKKRSRVLEVLEVLEDGNERVGP